MIVEGRLSAYFVEADLKVWFLHPLDIRSERISNRENKPLNSVEKEVLQEEKAKLAVTMKYMESILIIWRFMILVIKHHSFQPESIAEIILTATEVI